MSLIVRQLQQRVKLIAVCAVVLLAIQLYAGAFAPGADAHKNGPDQCIRAIIVRHIALTIDEGLCKRLGPNESSEHMEHLTHGEHGESRWVKKKPDD